MKFSMDISKFLVGRFQNALTFFIINRFGRDFFQSCVDFHGGGDRRGLRASGAAKRQNAKMHAPACLRTFLHGCGWAAVTQLKIQCLRFRIGRAYHFTPVEEGVRGSVHSWTEKNI